MHNEINNKNENKHKKQINSKNNINKYKCIFHCPYYIMILQVQ